MQSDPFLAQGHLDAILDLIRRGQADQAVLLLSGMLDQALAGGSGIVALRRRLSAHPLAALLDRPIVASAASRLGHARALVTRAALARAELDQAARQGLCVLTLSRQPRGYRLPRAPRAQFDLVVAADCADGLTPRRLPGFVACLSRQLSARGRIVLSSLSPGYLGYGWHTVCQRQDIHCHDATAITAAAHGAGLKSRIFDDASASILWAELRFPNLSHSRKERP